MLTRSIQDFIFNSKINRNWSQKSIEINRSFENFRLLFSKRLFEKLFLSLFSKKNYKNNYYRCDRSKLKAIENKKTNKCDKINLKVCLVMKIAPLPHRFKETRNLP